MPTTIDIENAKQIRQPMDVLITMQVPDDDISLTFSGYSSTAKVADGALAQKSWPMRTLADLQGEGFSLGGSAVLYDPSTSASQANGKLGVRGNVGQPVNLTVTGDQMITGLTLLVTGAESVTYNGGTHAVSAGRVSFLVGATSAPLTLTPSAADMRIQVSYVETGSEIRITNENLISCIVSLRSDLSVVDPTLPESELNIEAYNDVDISSAVANIPEDTPIVYRAGYDSNMSAERRFYVSGQVTWADNVLSIHAVDAVHFLDTELSPAYLTDLYSDTPELAPLVVMRVLRKMGLINSTPYNPASFKKGGANKEVVFIPKGVTMREIIAELSNVFRFRDIPADYLRSEIDQNERNYVFSYVDAGEPRVMTTNPSGSRIIKEEDCADIKTQIERPVSKITYKRNPVTSFNGEVGLFSPMNDGVPCGSAQILKGDGVFLSLDDYVFSFLVGEESEKIDPTNMYKYTGLVPAYNRGWFVTSPWFTDGSYMLGVSDVYPVFTGDTKNEELSDEKPIYSQVIPWTIQYDTTWYRWTSLTALWNWLTSRGFIGKDDTYFSTDIIGYKLNIEESEITVSNNVNNGREVALSGPLMGRSFFWSSETSRGEEAFPAYGLAEMLKRSNITGSFTWKGDPRMQPRDVVNFHRLDGTVEEITIETITLKHEGGGTTAEITYRKGVV